MIHDITAPGNPGEIADPLTRRGCGASAAETTGTQVDEAVAMDNTGSHQILLLGKFDCRFIAFIEAYSQAAFRPANPVARGHSRMVVNRSHCVLLV